LTSGASTRRPQDGREAPPPTVRPASQQAMRAWAHTLLLVLPSMGWRSGRRHGVSACHCDVRFYQASGFGNQPCTTPGVDFGCWPNEDTMWVRPPCGSIFRCNADHHDVGPDAARQRGALVRCGSRYFKPAPGQTQLNCTCSPKPKAAAKHFGERDAGQQQRPCGEHAIVDTSGGVSAAYRRLPMPPGANPAVKCCRNKDTSKGAIDWSVTLNFTGRDYASWPAACEAACDAHPSGRCKFFSHSFRFSSCILCATCQPEIMLGDDTYASFQRADMDVATLYTGVLA